MMKLVLLVVVFLFSCTTTIEVRQYGMYEEPRDMKGFKIISIDTVDYCDDCDDCGGYVKEVKYLHRGLRSYEKKY